MNTKLLSIICILLILQNIQAQTTDSQTNTMYAIAEGDTFASGTTIERPNITLTFGEIGGADFLAAQTLPINDVFKAYTPGNDVNGNKTGGTFYLFAPTKDGILPVGVRQNRVKPLYVEENGTVLSELNGITLDESQSDTYIFSFNVKAGCTYKLYCSGSKLGFYGFNFKWNSNSEQPSENNFETAAEAVKNMKVGINYSFELDGYRSQMDRDWNSDWQWIGQNAAQMPKMLQKAGYNTIRAHICWRKYMDSSGKINPEWMAHVRECVDYVINSGMYFLLGSFWEGEDYIFFSEEENYQQNKELFEYIWRQIAEEFKNYDHHLIFEGWNEMLDSYGWAGNPNYPNGYNDEKIYEPLNKYAQSFVDAVRSTGGNNKTRNLLINTFAASGGIEGDWIPGLTYFKIPQDEIKGHIFVGIHAYGEDLEAFDISMDNWRTWSEANNTPVIIGEMGHDVGNPILSYFERPDKIAETYRHLLKQARAHNLVPCVFIWSPLGAYRQMPAFDIPELHEAILKGYYGEDYEPEMRTGDEYDVWVSFTPEHKNSWIWGDPLDTEMFKGFLFEIENYPGDGLLDMHIGNDKNIVVEPVTSASTFFEFSSSAVYGNDAGAIWIEYKGEEPYTMKVKRIVLQKRDGREFTFYTPIWIQRHNPNNMEGANFESKLKKDRHPVTITANNLTMEYGEEVPKLTYTSEGDVLFGNPKLSTTATSSSPVGTYPIKVELGTVVNEQVTLVDGTLTIKEIPLAKRQYKAAQAAIEYEKKYGIFTTFNGKEEGLKRYYLTIDGNLTSIPKEAGIFSFYKTEGENLFCSPGWKLNACFSNPTLSDGATGELKPQGHILVDMSNRDDWEGQVWYLNDNERYAVRATNAVSNEWGASTFWTIIDTDDNGQPEADYSWTPTFVWQLESDMEAVINTSVMILGDANGDDVVNTADIVETVNAINGKASSKFILSNADLNNNGKADAADIKAIADIIMNPNK